MRQVPQGKGGTMLRRSKTALPLSRHTDTLTNPPLPET